MKEQRTYNVYVLSSLFVFSWFMGLYNNNDNPSNKIVRSLRSLAKPMKNIQNTCQSTFKPYQLIFLHIPTKDMFIHIRMILGGRTGAPWRRWGERALTHEHIGTHSNDKHSPHVHHILEPRPFWLVVHTVKRGETRSKTLSKNIFRPQEVFRS